MPSPSSIQTTPEAPSNSKIVLFIILGVVVISSIIFFIFRKDIFTGSRPLTPEEREEVVNQMIEYQETREATLTPEEREEVVNQMIEYQETREATLTPEEREEFINNLENFNNR